MSLIHIDSLFSLKSARFCSSLLNLCKKNWQSNTFVKTPPCVTLIFCCLTFTAALHHWPVLLTDRFSLIKEETVWTFPPFSQVLNQGEVWWNAVIISNSSSYSGRHMHFQNNSWLQRVRDGLLIVLNGNSRSSITSDQPLHLPAVWIPAVSHSNGEFFSTASPCRKLTLGNPSLEKRKIHAG